MSFAITNASASGAALSVQAAAKDQVTIPPKVQLAEKANTIAAQANIKNTGPTPPINPVATQLSPPVMGHQAPLVLLAPSAAAMPEKPVDYTEYYKQAYGQGDSGWNPWAQDAKVDLDRPIGLDGRSLKT